MADNKMLFLLWMLLYVTWVCSQEPPPCLTGNPQDVQFWVSETGEITEFVDRRRAVDLSGKVKLPAQLVEEIKASVLRSKVSVIQFLSLARNQLTRVPAIFDELLGHSGAKLSSSVQYLSFYGNPFIEVSSPGVEYGEQFNGTGATLIRPGTLHRGETRVMWSAGFHRVEFSKLKELDLRSCGIRTIDDMVFRNMPLLEALYLSGNSISLIQNNAFNRVRNLIHLDLSRNNHHTTKNPRPLVFECDRMFERLRNLKSLDLSHTLVNPSKIGALRSLGRRLERLSLCFAGPFRLEPGFFAGTSISVLDISGNSMILERDNVLAGLEDKLTVLYASDIGLTNFDVFRNFSRLEILRLGNNDMVSINGVTARSLVSLQAVDFSRNRFTQWSDAMFSNMPALNVLDLRGNTLNVINRKMIRDFANVTFLALSGNPVVCNCHAKEFIALAFENEMNLARNYVMPLPRFEKTSLRDFSYHSGFIDLNNQILTRRNLSRILSLDNQMKLLAEGNFVLIDYRRDAYTCLSLSQGAIIPFEEVNSCSLRTQLDEQLQRGASYLLALLVLPALLLPALFFGYTYRRNLKYFCVMIKNSALLSMVNENKTFNDDTIYNYDVFVSYCNEDRPWVLDQLLSHLEKDCSVSLCLHERDFQVGLTILENIVSCMDRSKSIMLVISKPFLKSHWCQFEMHLAQHRNGT